MSIKSMNKVISSILLFATFGFSIQTLAYGGSKQVWICGGDYTINSDQIEWQMMPPESVLKEELTQHLLIDKFSSYVVCPNEQNTGFSLIFTRYGNVLGEGHRLFMKGYQVPVETFLNTIKSLNGISTPK